MILVEGQEITLKSKIDSLRNYKRELLEIRKDTAHKLLINLIIIGKGG